MEKRIKEMLAVATVIMVAFGIGFLSLQLGVTTHEGFHTIAARLMGCETTTKTAIVSGSTHFSGCFMETNMGAILIALAGPLGAFALATFLWFGFGKNSLLRVIALFIFALSVIPSMFPALFGSDMSFAIAHGFNPIAGWGMFITVLGVITFWLMEELMDKKILVGTKIKI